MLQFSRCGRTAGLPRYHRGALYTAFRAISRAKHFCSIDFAPGSGFTTAMIEHSICSASADHIFVFVPFRTYNGTEKVAKVLQHFEKSHLAMQRLILASNILEDDQARS